MANIVQIEVDFLDNVMAVYNRIKVYKAATIDGTYAEVTNTGTRIVLNSQDNLYRYIDVGGISSDYYKTSYFNSSNSAESPLSQPIAAAGDTSIQLTDNMQVVIELDPLITNGANVSIGSPVFFFTTVCNPFYSSLRKVRLEIGAYIQNVSDDTLNLAIFEASLAADQLSWFKTGGSGFCGNTQPGRDNDFFKFARREWVTCTASQHLMQNFLTGMKSKKLDNLEVQYELIKPAEIMLKKLDACVQKWEKEIKSGGRAIQKSNFVVKGESDPEDPHVGRMWEKGPFVAKVGMSNLRYRPWGARRFVGGYRRMYTRLFRS